MVQGLQGFARVAGSKDQGDKCSKSLWLRAKLRKDLLLRLGVRRILASMRS